ncbi:MAG TPA: rod shape-determining protein MreD [Gammaproteobacteria bacterium]|nr:rod shape-determining protein MreD [Gammaproteobacteria bacterium]
MSPMPQRGGGVIIISFALALVLSVLPMPYWTHIYRPEWVTLVLIYWCIALPQRVGVGIGWGAGLLLDVINDAVLGQYALSLAVVAYLAVKMHRRIRAVPVWQQALTVLLLVGTQQMLVLWIKGIIGQAPWSMSYWLPALVSMLLWPPVFTVLRGLRRRYVTSSK